MTRSERACWRAPGRVNLIGEHTDYNDGFALPLAIEQACTATVAIDSRPGVRVTSAQRRESIDISTDAVHPDAAWVADDAWAGYAVGVLWALRRRGWLAEDDRGLAIHVDSTVPLGAGLSSSAAMSCAVAAAVNDVLTLHLSRAQLAAAADEAEIDFVGAPTGGMDQLASLLSVEGHVLLCDMRDRTTRPVALPLADKGLTLLVVDTQAPHQHSDGEYAERRRSCEQAATELGVAALRNASIDDVPRLSSPLLQRRARHVITENARVLDTVALLEAGNVTAIGTLLTASHDSMREDFEITVPEVDVAVSALLESGALGARMTGGGFGGCVIGLVAVETAASSAAAVEGAYRQHDFAAPSWFVTEAGPGAYRID